jgi:hypothetical protein
MKRICLITGFIITLIPNSISQVFDANVKISGLHPVFIDTINEKVLVVHRRSAVLFFKQSDIQEYTNHHYPLKLSNEYFQITNSLLKSNKKRIEIFDLTAESYETEASRIYNNTAQHPAMTELWYIGADLIRTGKFMILDNQSNTMIYRGLKMQSNYGFYSTRTDQFRLPSGNSFWHTNYIISE